MSIIKTKSKSFSTKKKILAFFKPFLVFLDSKSKEIRAWLLTCKIQIWSSMDLKSYKKTRTIKVGSNSNLK